MDESLVIAGVVTRADQKHDQNFPLQKVPRVLFDISAPTGEWIALLRFKATQ